MVPGVLAPTHAVDRPALLARLDGARAGPLTLIVAPAGAGKSVMLAQWSASRPELPFVWMGLTPNDDDPVRFSRRFLDRLAPVCPNVTELGSLIPLHGGGLGTPLLEALGTELEEAPAMVLVFDDLHQLSNATLLADLGQLVERLPNQVHLVLASRADPPIAWSHHRLTRELTELRQADLAFDERDSARLLERITGRPLGTDQVNVLVQRTEGWAAGLQLAAMTLRGHDDSDRFITQFSGNDRLVADYLSEQVLEAQSPERRAFLLRISILDELCGDLANHMTGEAHSQLLLEELERESMFLVPLDDRREWYRFHHLFRDLLRFRLRAEDPGAEEELLGAAADWHLGRGDVNAAVEYLVRARRWDAVLDLIMGRGTQIFERGQMATVIRWITAVPGAVRSGRRDVRLLLAFLMGAEGQAVGCEDILRSVMADPAATRGERACGQTLLATLAQFRSNPEVTVEMAHTALELLAGLDGHPIPPLMNLADSQSLETLAVGSCGRGHFLAGRLDDAREWMQRGLDSPGAGYSGWRIGLLGSLALVEGWSGRLERAEALADQALGVARDAGILVHPVTAEAFLAASLVALERGQPRQAAIALREGCLRAEANRRTPLRWIGRLLSAEQQAAEGHPDLAAATIAAARRQLGAPPPPVAEHGLLALRCRLLRLEGAAEQAWRLLRDDPVGPTPVLVEAVASALTTDRPDHARKLLDGASWTGSGPKGRAQGEMLTAWLAAAEGYPDQAAEPLRRAMDEAHRHGLVEALVRGGPVVVRMVAELPDVPTTYRDTVLARARETTAPARVGELPDPLTDRELEILSYLPSRLTNGELAERCYVSVNTIKTHMAHIYRKLDAANRNEAIVRARQLGLL